jgi:hypothetical protein
MELQDALADLREQLEAVEERGDDQVHVGALRKYLDALEQDAAASQEQQNRVHAGMLAHYAANTQFSVEMLKAVLEAGKSALQALILINGGAVVALLGVMSNLAGKTGGAELARFLALPMLQFGIGVLLAAVGFALRYLSQAFYAEISGPGSVSHKWGDRLRIAAIGTALAGYVLFGFAVVNSYHAVLWSFAPSHQQKVSPP